MSDQDQQGFKRCQFELVLRKAGLKHGQLLATDHFHMLKISKDSDLAVKNAHPLKKDFPLHLEYSQHLLFLYSKNALQIFFCLTNPIPMVCPSKSKFCKLSNDIVQLQRRDQQHKESGRTIKMREVQKQGPVRENPHIFRLSLSSWLDFELERTPFNLGVQQSQHPSHGTPCLIQFNYPFLNHNAPLDPFENPLAQCYDVLYQPHEPQCKEEMPKVEAATSPGYIVEEPVKQPTALEIQDREEKREKGKNKVGKSRDDDYRPYQRIKKSERNRAPRQKQDRNLIPNTVHHILAFVQKRFKSIQLAQTVFDHHNTTPEYNLTRFYIFHKMLRVRINHYVNEDALKLICEAGQLDCDEFDMAEQTFYCFISRVMIRHFLKREAILLILLSRKVKKDNIIEHLRVQRFLYENLTASWDGN